jgi:hypothetical protein
MSYNIPSFDREMAERISHWTGMAEAEIPGWLISIGSGARWRKGTYKPKPRSPYDFSMD